MSSRPHRAPFWILALIVLVGAGCTTESGRTLPASSRAREKGDGAQRGALSPFSTNLPNAINDIDGQNLSLSNPAQEASGPTTPVFLPGEELWIISAPSSSTPPVDGPGTGSLLARGVAQEEVAIPLEHTSVEAEIAGFIATVDVEQRFRNPYDQKIEAIYVFPLPTDAAVHEFVMSIGERRIRGIVRKREEAEQIYRDARAQGHVASLLTQERPNVFTQSVANIEPGKSIDISIRYFNTVAYRDGEFVFTFPMVVGPRYNPPGTRDGIGTQNWPPNPGGQKTSVPYLKPAERSGHDIALSVRLDAGVEVDEIASPSHAIDVSARTETGAHIALSPHDTIPNRDFVLRYQVAGESLKSALLTHADDRGRYFTMMVVPPARPRPESRRPVELIFVLDCSGSMKGEPLETAKRSARRALKLLSWEDTFQIIRFSSESSSLGPRPVIAAPRNVYRGLSYLDELQSGGGTEMISGIRAALSFPADPDRLRVVSFMTDGFIGNEAEILSEVHRGLGDARIFSFGVGRSVNRHLMEELARAGRGAVAYVGLGGDDGRVVDLFYDRLRYPCLQDLSISSRGVEIVDVQPSRLPDLFVGRPVIVTGRLRGSEAGTIEIRGRRQDMEVTLSHVLDPSYGTATHPGIPHLWARQTIASLARTELRSPGESTASGIRDLALEYGLLSRFTAFLAVDASRRTEGDHGIRVPVPVPVPAGVRYDTTVRDR